MSKTLIDKKIEEMTLDNDYDFDVNEHGEYFYHEDAVRKAMEEIAGAMFEVFPMVSPAVSSDAEVDVVGDTMIRMFSLLKERYKSITGKDYKEIVN